MKPLFQIVALAFVFLLSHTASAEEKEEKSSAAYFALEPSLVSNLNGGPEYIRCEIKLMTKKADRLADIEQYAPQIRHEVLMLLIEQDGKALLTLEGKETLRKAIKKVAREILEEETDDPLVKEVFFTTFYVR